MAIKNNDEIIENVKEVVKKDKKKAYRVILATKNYYIIDKDGVNVRVDKANSFKVGSKVEF